jgi:hypothetical protein
MLSSQLASARATAEGKGPAELGLLRAELAAATQGRAELEASAAAARAQLSVLAQSNRDLLARYLAALSEAGATSEAAARASGADSSKRSDASASLTLGARDLQAGRGSTAALSSADLTDAQSRSARLEAELARVALSSGELAATAQRRARTIERLREALSRLIRAPTNDAVIELASSTLSASGREPLSALAPCNPRHRHHPQFLTYCLSASASPHVCSGTEGDSEDAKALMSYSQLHVSLTTTAAERDELRARCTEYESSLTTHEAELRTCRAALISAQEDLRAAEDRVCEAEAATHAAVANAERERATKEAVAVSDRSNRGAVEAEVASLASSLAAARSRALTVEGSLADALIEAERAGAALSLAEGRREASELALLRVQETHAAELSRIVSDGVRLASAQVCVFEL